MLDARIVDQEGPVVTEEKSYKKYIVNGSADVDATDTLIWLRNKDDGRKLVIDSIKVFSDAATQYQIHKPSGTTAAGTELTPVGKDLEDGTSQAVEAYYDETGNTQGTIVERAYGAANEVVECAKGFELGYNQELAVDIVSEPTGCWAQAEFHFEED